MLKIFLWMPTVLQALFDIFLILNKNVHEKRNASSQCIYMERKLAFN